MRDHFEILELAIFLILIVLVLPLLSSLYEFFPLVTFGLCVILLLPAPVWLARLRFAMPERLETVIFWHSAIAWILFLCVVVLGIALYIFGWFAQL